MSTVMGSPRASVPIPALMAVVFCAALAVYWWGGAPSVLIGDGAELQAVALTGGVPHPSGYPTFVLCGQLFRHLLPGEPARRMTEMSALFGALALALLLFVLTQMGVRPAAALGAVAFYGCSFTFWWSAIVTSQYTLAVGLFLLAFWRSLVALRTGRPGDAVGAAVLLGLTLTGHLAFTPAVAVLGLTLAYRQARRGPASLGTLALLSLGFALGLTPYLYLVWADLTPHAMNYLNYTVELGSHQFGLRPAIFSQPWQRIPWLILGQEAHPTVNLRPRAVMAGLLDAGAGETLFELGPLAILLAVAGVLRMTRRSRALLALLLGIIGSSALFAIVLSTGRMMPVFLMPCTLGLAMATAFGLEALADRFDRRPAVQRRVAGTLATLLMVPALLLPHALRLYANHHPIGPLRWQVHPKEPHGPVMETLIPRLRNDRGPREYGEQAFQLIPRGSLVIGSWSRIMILYYLRYAEGRRPDLTLEPYYEAHLVRLWRWQQQHDPAKRPFVLLNPIAQLDPWFAAGDSLALSGHEWLYVRRSPIPVDPQRAR